MHCFKLVPDLGKKKKREEKCAQPTSCAMSVLDGREEYKTKLTTSVFVILARRSVRLSPHGDWSAESSCRPQIAAPTLPVAIMEGGYMANLKSVWRKKYKLS